MKKAAIGTAVVIAGASAAAIFVLEPSPQTAVVQTQSTPTIENGVSRLPSGLPERKSLSGDRTDVFAAARWAQPPVSPKPKPQAQESASAGVSAPPVPYRFVGTVKHGKETVYALAKGDSVFPINTGDTLEGTYRVEEITPQMVTLTYLPLEERTMLVLATLTQKPAVATNFGAQTPSSSLPIPQPATAVTSAATQVGPPTMRAAQLRGPRNVQH